MATGTVYLDVDDEITSAAARIRGSEATKVALVIPYGSRIATSRMNFRLLSREAVVNNRRLSIVASDAATRALAASAGLPVFASVAEYDAAAASGPSSATDAGGGPAGVAGVVAAGAADAAATDAALPVPPPDEPPESNGTEAAAAATIAAAGTAIASAAAAPGPSAPPIPEEPVPPVSDETQKTVVRPMAPATSLPAPVTAAVAAAAGTSSVASAPTVRVPVIRSRRMPRIGAPAVVIAAVAVLAIVVVAVAGYVFLPSAEITVTPKAEPIPPISLTVRADPDATTTDTEAGIVPASRLDVPVTVSETFATKGRRVEEGKATGEVTFTSENTFIEVTVPRGTRVATKSGIAFVTTAQVVIPKASFASGPARRDARIEAVKAGTSGNVEPGTITERPSELRLLLVSVTNAAATSGGTHEEFPQVSQAEVDEALATLNTEIADAFTAAVADGAGAPANSTLYPETAVLGTATPSVDPATLVGQAVESFDLGLSATGTVIAVDASPVEGIARSRLDANVGPEYQLIEDSVNIRQGDATVANGEVSFPVTASGSRIRVLDPSKLLALVKGKSLDDAKAALAPFGQVEITRWPEWVSSVPSIDSRVSLVIVGQDGAPAAPTGSASPRADGSP
jgi:hypothetical protein